MVFEKFSYLHSKRIILTPNFTPRGAPASSRRSRSGRHTYRRHHQRGSYAQSLKLQAGLRILRFFKDSFLRELQKYSEF